MLRTSVWLTVLIAIVAGCSFTLKARAADPLKPGASAPDFSLPSQEDAQVTLSQFKGKWVVLYFYPRT